MEKANKNKTVIYTKQCVLCGQTEEYAELVGRLKAAGKIVEVRQTSLFFGWNEEAKALGLELPAVFDYDTKNKMTVAEANQLDSLTTLIGETDTQDEN